MPDQPTEPYPRGEQPTQPIPRAGGEQLTERIPGPGELPTTVLPEFVQPTAPVAAGSRRVPVRPIVLTVAGIVAAAVLSVVIVTLLSNSRQPVVLPTPAPTTPSASATPAPTQAPVAEPRPEAGPNECVDALGDGATIDIDRVVIEEHDGDLVAQFTLAAPLPAGQTGLGIVVESRNGRDAYQVAAEFSDGELNEYFFHDFEGDDDSLDDEDVAVDRTTVALVLPDNVIEELGRNWGWYGFTVAAGADADACPGDVGSGDMLRYAR